MELVIDIDECIYKRVSNSDAYILDKLDFKLIENAIANGTPLPEGHGNLIDANLLADRLVELRDGWDYYGDEYKSGVYTGYNYALDEIIDAPTIIASKPENWKERWIER